MSAREMIQVLDDPDRKLGRKGAPAGPELEEEKDQWAYAMFAGDWCNRAARRPLVVMSGR